MTKLPLKILAVLLSIILTVESVWAAPKFVSPFEVPTLAAIDLPDDLGRVETLKTAGDQTIFHIQTVHVNAEAAKQVERIVRYLQEKYKVDLLFAEGAAGDLDIKRLQFFSDKKKNRGKLETMLEDGILTSADMAFSDGKLNGVGVETVEGYLEAYKYFRDVLGKKSESEAWLSQQKLNLEKQTSKIFSPETQTLIKAWEKYEANHRDFGSTIQFLSESAKVKLDLDLEHPLSQFVWPQLVRVMALQKLEKEIDGAALDLDLKSIQMWIDQHKIKTDFLESLKTKQTISRGELDAFLKLVVPKQIDLSK